MLLLKSFIQVSLLASGICLLVYLGYFSQVSADLGLEHYAERNHFSDLIPSLRGWLEMPLNTVVCFGYMIVGIQWIVQIEDVFELSPTDGYLMAVFNWMSVLYGPVQCLRIITQLHPFAVLDQWFTLPFFAWVVVWARHCLSNEQENWSRLFPTVAMSLSLLSYCLAILYKYGFEVTLGVHVLFAVIAGLKTYRKYPNPESKSCVYKAFLCCSGFVLLKLLDLTLKDIHWIFTLFSGHFVSKVCDILQIHYVNAFFFNITVQKGKMSSTKNKKKK